jgi:hypothetical protein
MTCLSGLTKLLSPHSQAAWYGYRFRNSVNRVLSSGHLTDVILNQPLVLHTFSRISVPKMGDSLRMLYPTWFDCKSAHGLCCMMSLERASVEGSWQNWR